MTDPKRALGVVGALFNAFLDDEDDRLKEWLAENFNVDVGPEDVGAFAHNYGSIDDILEFLGGLHRIEGLSAHLHSDIRETTAEERKDFRDADAVVELTVDMLGGQSEDRVYFKVAEGKVTYAHYVVGNTELALRAFHADA